MSTQVTITLTDGRVIQGLSYRMSTGVPVNPTVPASPITHGMYHIQGDNGWVDIPASEVASVVLHPGRPT
jgi:hypothetical protein